MGRQVTAEATASITAERVLGSLDIRIPAVQAAAGYRVALAALACAMVLIAVLFLGLLAFMGWLVIWHVIGAVASLSQGPYFIFHIPMALLGLLLLVFLIKPIFFRRKNMDDQVLRVTADQEPLLFEFVHKLCKVVGARAPAIIELDCQANAGAGFGRGLRSLAAHEMTLRIGLPLVRALPLRQFAGILAHELGHFNQHHGMIWSYLIRRLNQFFARIVFERDRLDDWLERLRANRSGAGRATYLVAAALIEPARGVLWLMLVIAELLTCHALQRMEFDADGLEARIAGAESFARTNELMALLQIAGAQTQGDLAAAFETRRLPDDLPRMIVARARELAGHTTEIYKALGREKTRWFDTHPCHADRVRNVERLATVGAMRCDLPATALFRNFSAKCRDASQAYYRSVLGKEYRDIKLVRAADLANQQAGRRDAMNKVRRYFQDQLLGSRPVLPLPDSAGQAPEHAGPVARELMAARERMVGLAADMGPAIENHEKALVGLAIAEALVALARIAPPATARQLRRRAEADTAQARAELADSERLLNPFEAAAEVRLTRGLQLLWSPTVLRRMEGDGAAAQREVRQCMELCEGLRACREHLCGSRDLALKAHVLFAALPANERFMPLEHQLRDILARARRGLDEGRNALGSALYPFEHGTRGITCADFVVPRMPDLNDVGDVAEACTAGMDRFADLAFGVLAKLVGHAERVEAALGLTALAEPDDAALREQARKKAMAEQKREERHYWFWYGLRAAAGTALLALLLWLSIDPPTLPSMPWEHRPRGSVAYRPAGFSMAGAPRTLTMSYRPSAPPGRPSWFEPGNPGYFERGQPGHRVGMPSNWQSGPGRQITPGQVDPRSPSAQPGFSRPAYEPGRPFGLPPTPTYTPPPPIINRPPTYKPPEFNQPSRQPPGVGSPGRSQPGRTGPAVPGKRPFPRQPGENPGEPGSPR